MFSQSRQEVDLEYIRKSLDDFMYYNRESLPDLTEPHYLKCHYPQVTAAYFGKKHETEPFVKIVKAAPPQSAKSIEIAKQAAAKGLLAVEVFRTKSTSFYEWDRKLQTLTSLTVLPDFQSWITGIKVIVPDVMRKVYPDLCERKIKLSKEWPHPKEQLAVMIELIATLWNGLRDFAEIKRDIKYLANCVYHMVIDCKINDIPDEKTPPPVYEACWIALDKARDQFLACMQRGFSKIKEPHLAEVFKYTGFVIWMEYGFRSPEDPESIRRVKHYNGKYKIYCDVLDNLVKL